MQLKLKEMQAKYLKYVDEELEILSYEERLRFLQEYLLEKSQIYNIYHGDLINKTDNTDKLKSYLKRLISDLYWLFTQRDKLEKEL